MNKYYKLFPALIILFLITFKVITASEKNNPETISKNSASTAENSDLNSIDPKMYYGKPGSMISQFSMYNNSVSANY